MMHRARRLRNHIWETFEYPESSPLAFGISLVAIAAILLSSITFCLETVPTLSDGRNARLYDVSEKLCISIFTFEYGTRLLTTPDLRAFFVSPMNAVDLVAIVPFYVQMSLGGANIAQTRIVRIVRIVRVLRIIKLARRFDRIQVVTSALSQSRDMLWLLVFLVIICLICFSTLIYFCERGVYHPELGYWSRGLPYDVTCTSQQLDALPPGSAARQGFVAQIVCVPGPTPFSSIPAACWWGVTTLLTVGYGDAVPFSGLGKLVAGGCMVFGLLILALPISVIGTEFTQQWLDYKATNEGSATGSRRAPRFSALRQALSEHNMMLDDIMRKLRDVLFEIDDLRARLIDKSHRHKSEVEAQRTGGRQRRAEKTRSYVPSATRDMKHETQMLVIELELKTKLMQLQELLDQSEVIHECVPLVSSVAPPPPLTRCPRSAGFIQNIDAGRGTYMRLQQSASNVASIAEETDDTEQALESVLTGELNARVSQLIELEEATQFQAGIASARREGSVHRRTASV
jgi:hypothetical protein